MRFLKIKLQANDLQRLHDFYKEVIGLPVFFDAQQGLLEIRSGSTLLVFAYDVVDPKPVYHIAFTIPSNKFNEAYEWMSAKTPLRWLSQYNSTIADFANWNAHSFYFNDAAGNVLEFISRHDLQNNSPNAFSPAQILCISELGLVFSDSGYEQEVRDFMLTFSLDYYEKQPPLKSFRAIGDAEGLFIAVPANRPWFGDEEKISRRHPIDVTFVSAGHEYRWINK